MFVLIVGYGCDDVKLVGQQVCQKLFQCFGMYVLIGDGDYFVLLVQQEKIVLCVQLFDFFDGYVFVVVVGGVVVFLYIVVEQIGVFYLDFVCVVLLGVDLQCDIGIGVFD